MAEKKESKPDEVSAEGFNDIELAYPVLNSVGQQTHWRKVPVSKELYDQQMAMAEEDRNPEFRKGAFKKASSLSESDFKQPVVEQEIVQTEEQKELAALREEMKQLRALVKPAAPAKPAEQPK